MKVRSSLFAGIVENYPTPFISIAAFALMTGCGMSEQPPSFQVAEAGELNLVAEGGTVDNLDAQGVTDGGVEDGGVADSGTQDGGTLDGGSQDGGTTDTGTQDSGTADNGTADNGTADNGTADSGTADSGVDDGSSTSGNEYPSDDSTTGDTSGDSQAGDDTTPTDGTGDDVVDGGGSDDAADDQTDPGAGTGGDVDLGDGQDDTVEPTPAEIAACANEHGVGKGAVVVAGNQQTITMGQVVAVKAAGNQPNLRINLLGGGEKYIAGICIFATGNQAKIELNVGVTLGALFYKGRGNKSATTVNVAEGAALQGLFGNLSGNQAGLTVQGNGTYPCYSVVTSGNNSSFVCQ